MDKMMMALRLATNSPCVRRKWGAVVVDAGGSVIGIGYNSVPKSAPVCAENNCIREQLGISSGERYDLCWATHAEVNAVLSTGEVALDGCVLYLAGYEADGTIACGYEPCEMCRRVIRAYGIHEVHIFKESRGKIIETVLGL